VRPITRAGRPAGQDERWFSRMAKLPPDFTKLFFDALGGVAEPVRYPLRSGPYLLHDVAFLSSLLHDARVLNPRADAVDGVLVVRFNRDCWELGALQKEGSSELYVADSTLTCRGVRSVTWHLFEDGGKEPWLDYVWVDDGYRTDEQFSFFLKGHEWHCRIVLEELEWSVALEDEETPYLWSVRHAG
jgi:hypothetical protein